MAKKLTFQNLPTNLSWRRSVDVSEGFLNSVMTDGSLVPVEVNAITVRGAIGSYNAGFDKSGNPLTGEKLQSSQNPTSPNIQRIHVAHLHPESDTLSIRFSMGVHGATAFPYTCNSKEYAAAASRFIDVSRDLGLYSELAERYVWALANGGIFWRNGVGMKKSVVVTVTGDEGFSCNFTTKSLEGRRGKLSYPGFDAVIAADTSGNARRLADIWTEALAGGDYLALEVEARVTLFKGAEVWPSQEFVNPDSSKDAPSKVLSFREMRVGGVAVQHATMHSQKLGNAIRTFDDWHGNVDYGSISVEAFGWYQSDAVALRTSGGDAYTVLRDLPNVCDALLADGSRRNEALYALSTLARGGVYVMAGKGDKDTGDKDAGDSE